MFIKPFLSSQARSQRTFLWIIQYSEIRLVENHTLCPVLSTEPAGRGLCNWAFNACEIASTFPHSNSPLHTRETANDSPTCVILAQCPEKQYNLVSMTERQLTKDLLYRVHKLACKSAPRCPPFPSHFQNTYFAENCCFAFLFFSPQQRGLPFSKRARDNNLLWH